MTTLRVAWRSLDRRATVSDLDATQAPPAARIRSARRRLGRTRSLRASPMVEMPAAEIEHETLHPLWEGDGELGADEAAHRVAHDGGRIDTELTQQTVQQAGIAEDRDLLLGHWRAAEAGQVEGDHAVLGGEHGQLLEPVGPGARQAVDEDERRPLAQLDRVDGRSPDAHPALVGAPVDVEPCRAAHRAVLLSALAIVR